MALVGALDPTRPPRAERDADLPSGPLRRRRRSRGARLALLDIRKPRGDVFLDELERLLAERGHTVERAAKPTFTKPAPADVRREIAEHCDAVIEALAD